MKCNYDYMATMTVDKSVYGNCLELSLLRLEDTVELGGEHDVALDLELARHESLLAVDLAVSEIDEGVVGKVDGNIGLALGLALVSLGVLSGQRKEERKRKEVKVS